LPIILPKISGFAAFDCCEYRSFSMGEDAFGKEKSWFAKQTLSEG
jgi:hypothetical protein